MVWEIHKPGAGGIHALHGARCHPARSRRDPKQRHTPARVPARVTPAAHLDVVDAAARLCDALGHLRRDRLGVGHPLRPLDRALGPADGARDREARLARLGRQARVAPARARVGPGWWRRGASAGGEGGRALAGAAYQGAMHARTRG